MGTDARQTGVQAVEAPGAQQQVAYDQQGPAFTDDVQTADTRSPETRPYSSHGNRAHLHKRDIKATIPEKADQAANRNKRGSRDGRPVNHDADLYEERNTVEHLITQLKTWRGIATRYDKTPDSHPAGLHLHTPMISIKDLAPDTP